MPVFEAVELPFCTALLVDEWDTPPCRYFLAYATRGAYRWVLGHPVVDEFGTFSSPIFVAPAALLGKIYGFGISLGHRRDPGMGIDLGWPPLCAGLDVPAPPLPEDWEEELFESLDDPSRRKAGETNVESWVAGAWEMSRWVHGEVTIVGTSAPLLPRHLRRLCETVDSPMAIAFATANGLRRSDSAEPTRVEVLSERRFREGILDSLMARRNRESATEG